MADGTKANALETDEDVLKEVETALLKAAEGHEAFRDGLAQMFRQAIDEVIDTPRTRRRLLEDLEKTEKTYLGTKVEILFRNLLRLDRGSRFDLRVGIRDVDVKFTIGSNWAIPKEALNQICLLLACSEGSGVFHAGLFIAREEDLTHKPNRDGKRSISKAGRAQIRWICHNAAYPRNFWASVSASDAEHIMDMKVSGNERVRRLFVALLARPIPRRIVESVGQQKDFMKRLRKNGGARDALERDGYRLLSGAYNAEEIRERGFPACARDEFICVKI